MDHKYTVTAYLDAGCSELTASLTNVNFDEVKKFLHDHCTQGRNCIVELADDADECRFVYADMYGAIMASDGIEESDMFG